MTATTLTTMAYAQPSTPTRFTASPTIPYNCSKEYRRLQRSRWTLTRLFLFSGTCPVLGQCFPMPRRPRMPSMKNQHYRKAPCQSGSPIGCPTSFRIGFQCASPLSVLVVDRTGRVRQCGRRHASMRHRSTKTMRRYGSSLPETAASARLDVSISLNLHGNGDRNVTDNAENTSLPLPTSPGHAQQDEVTNDPEASTATLPFAGVPSTRQMLVFVFTTVLVWVSEPLLSLVDSAAVGTFAGRSSLQIAATDPTMESVIQLAALGPATMLCDSAIYITYFLGMAATNRFARAAARRDLRSQITTSSHVLGVSVALGLLVSVALLVFGEPLLRSIIGPTGAMVADALTGQTRDETERVVRLALGYVRLRALAAIFAVTGSTSQSLLLCVLDTKTVTTSVVVATVLNIAGDMGLVAWGGKGVWGAALATSLASIAANVLLIWRNWNLVSSWRNSMWKENYGTVPPSNKKHAPTWNDEKSYNDYRVAPFISFPDKKSFLSLISFAGPIFFVNVGKLVEFWAMTVRAGDFGMLALACQNVLMRVLFFFGTFGDALAQAAETFLPGLFIKAKPQILSKTTNPPTPNAILLESSTSLKSSQTRLKPRPRSRHSKARQLIRKLSILSAVLGLHISILARCIANHSGAAFTSDARLVALMSRVSNYMGLVLLVHPLKEMLEGTMVASRDLTYLLWSYAVTGGLFLMQLRFCGEFMDIWKGLVVSQVVRIGLFGVRSWMMTKESDR